MQRILNDKFVDGPLFNKIKMNCMLEGYTKFTLKHLHERWSLFYCSVGRCHHKFRQIGHQWSSLNSQSIFFRHLAHSVLYYKSDILEMTIGNFRSFFFFDVIRCIVMLLVQNDTWISIQSQCKTLRDRAGGEKFFSFYDVDCQASYIEEDVTVERPFCCWCFFFIRRLKFLLPNKSWITSA